MSQIIWFTTLLLFYAFVSSYGLGLIKVAAGIRSLEFLFGGFLYGLGFLAWLVVLRSYPLSIAFPIASGLLIVSTQLVGVFVLGEDVRYLTLIGIAFILFGISLIYSVVVKFNG